MFDPLEWILRLTYCYGRIVGVLYFEVDWRTGRVEATQRSTIYAAVHNANLILLLYILDLFEGSIRSAWSRARYLHEYFFLLMAMVRTLAVLLTLVNQWRLHSRVLKFWNRLILMARQRPEVVDVYRGRVLLKFVIGALSGTMHIVLDLSAQRKKITLGLGLNLLVWYSFSITFNMIVAQYYLAIIQIYGHYNLLQLDLRFLMHEADNICHLRNPRGGVFITKCCSLADRLDMLAERQARLQGTYNEMGEIFQIMSSCLALVDYVSTMGTIYYAFCSILYSSSWLGSSNWGLLLIIVATAFYYLDNFITLNIGFLVQDQQDDLSKILAERTLFSRELDERLETTFEKFQLQLVRNPMEYYVLGLFKVERRRLIIMANSVMTHSIVLVQWEIQNNWYRML
ncbi:hypothetical protein KR009_009206 [Drosophila setifemur]|nr:hypothetical protein KR009_009206 [Drosophila setifemur]